MALTSVGWDTVWRGIRDVVLFVFGIVGVGYEAMISLEPRIELLILYAAALGLPVFLRANQANGGDK